MVRGAVRLQPPQRPEGQHVSLVGVAKGEPRDRDRIEHGAFVFALAGRRVEARGLAGLLHTLVVLVAPQQHRREQRMRLGGQRRVPHGVATRGGLAEDHLAGAGGAALEHHAAVAQACPRPQHGRSPGIRLRCREPRRRPLELHAIFQRAALGERAVGAGEAFQRGPPGRAADGAHRVGQRRVAAGAPLQRLPQDLRPPQARFRSRGVAHAHRLAPTAQLAAPPPHAPALRLGGRVRGEVALRGVGGGRLRRVDGQRVAQVPLRLARPRRSRVRGQVAAPLRRGLFHQPEALQRERQVEARPRLPRLVRQRLFGRLDRRQQVARGMRALGPRQVGGGQVGQHRCGAPREPRRRP